MLHIKRYLIPFVLFTTLGFGTATSTAASTSHCTIKQFVIRAQGTQALPGTHFRLAANVCTTDAKVIVKVIKTSATRKIGTFRLVAGVVHVRTDQGPDYNIDRNSQIVSLSGVWTSPIDPKPRRDTVYVVFAQDGSATVIA